MIPLFRPSLLVLLVAACATTVETESSDKTVPDPIKGYWRFSDQVTTIMIDECASKAGRLCGLLIGFDGEASARNFETSDFNRWGERKCRSQVLQIVPDPERPSSYTGRVQDHSDGQTYAIELTLRSTGLLEAHTFLSVSLDETVGMAADAALGGAPSILDTTSYLARAFAGKELHSEIERWRRISIPHQRCDRPSIKLNKGVPE